MCSLESLTLYVKKCTQLFVYDLFVLLVFLDLPSPWEAIKFSKDALKVNDNHASLKYASARALICAGIF